MVCNSGWQLTCIVSHHNQSFVIATTKGFDDSFYPTTVIRIESMQGFIQYQ